MLGVTHVTGERRKTVDNEWVDDLRRPACTAD